MNDAYMDIHIDEVLELPLVDAEAVAQRKFKVVVDGVNSSGGIIIPKLLEQMGVEVVKLYFSSSWYKGDANKTSTYFCVA